MGLVDKVNSATGAGAAFNTLDAKLANGLSEAVEIVTRTEFSTQKVALHLRAPTCTRTHVHTDTPHTILCACSRVGPVSMSFAARRAGQGCNEGSGS